MIEARSVNAEDLKKEARKLGRLVAISFVDDFLYYHFFLDKILVIKVKPKDRKVDSISDLFLNAHIYERELHDFFDLEFEGNPRLHEKLFLSDDTEGPVR